jgi:hypothetical protein
MRLRYFAKASHGIDAPDGSPGWMEADYVKMWALAADDAGRQISGAGHGDEQGGGGLCRAG